MSHRQQTIVSDSAGAPEIGGRLRSLRGEGVTQEAWAERLQVSRKTVERWEKGTAIPDGASLLALLRTYGADPVWVLTGERLAPSLSAAEQELLQCYRSTDHEGRQAVLRMARMECSRMSEPTHAYAVKPQTSSAVLLHDAPPPAKKKPPAR